MRRRAVIPALVVACALWLCPLEAKAQSRPVFMPFHAADGSVQIAIRAIGEGKERTYLVVDAETLDTSLIGEKELGRPATKAGWERTRYAMALEKYNAPSRGLQDAGLRRAAAGGLYLTIDLCPSSREMDAGLFKTITGESPRKGRPFPVAVAASGLWMKRHEDELAEILELERKGALSITWVNHTMTHPYSPGAPLEANFMLKAGVDLEKETLENEEEMIKRGLLPSPFFRFPGLVSDSKLLAKLKTLSLIPIGADAWLAKGEKPRKGSIILVHGNGNEPAGVKKLLEFLESGKWEVESGSLEFLPLGDAVER